MSSSKSFRWASAVLLSVLWVLSAAGASAWAGQARHVVIVVWDGLRPDCVNESDTPALWSLRKAGVCFDRHHPVYPSSTEVNATALATGAYPRHGGVMANKEYRPEINVYEPVGSESDYAIWKADRLRQGHYVRQPTLIEVARKAGLTTAVAGSKPVALLWDRQARDARAAEGGSIVFAGLARPSALIDEIRDAFGPIPPVAESKRRANAQQDDWTTRVLLEKLWARQVPGLTVLWLSEPDYSQHGSGPGSAVARAAIRNCDKELGLVLSALEKANVRDKTDVLVVSDHGFSTIAYTSEISDDLKKADLKAATSFATEPSPGDILVDGNGGTVCFYVTGHDEAVTRKLVEFLQKTAYAGVIFSARPLPGAFTLDQVGIDTQDAPDVVLSMRWWSDTSATGLPGMVISESKTLGHGQGMHASLSRYDMHNTLIAAGPDFRGGMVDKLPSGSADIAPTVLWILGIKPATALDGRILGEALKDGPAVEGQPTTTTIEATTKSDDLRWRQYLKITRLGQWVYYDEGNGKVLFER